MLILYTEDSVKLYLFPHFFEQPLNLLLTFLNVISLLYHYYVFLCDFVFYNFGLNKY